MAENLDWVDIRNIKRYGDPSSGGGGGWHPDYTEDNPPDFDVDNIFHPLVVYSNNDTWYVPKDGWYKIICIGRAGNIGQQWPTYVTSGCNISGPGSGGIGAIAISNLYLHKMETYNITINDIESRFQNIVAGAGKTPKGFVSQNDGGVNNDSSGGAAGIASGGNYININGKPGAHGGTQQGVTYSVDGYPSDPRSYTKTYSTQYGNSDVTVGGPGGYCVYNTVPCIAKYHYSNPANVDITTKNLIDVANKRVVYGTSMGYQSPGRFMGCVIIETVNNI